jgi:glycerophosphoryl diester phosphodiesterase
LLSGALADLRLCWRQLALADLSYKGVAFAVLAPAAALLMRWLIPDSHGRVLADVDILRFFVTSWGGVLSLLLMGAVLAAITALEVACLLRIALGASQGRTVPARRALAFAGTRIPHVLALTSHMVVRVAAVAVPFLAGMGLVYWAFLSAHDINYYLASHPAAFWAAVVLVVLLGGGLVALLLWAVARWAIALPLVLFESVAPRSALLESARRSAGRRWALLAALGAWAATALALATAATWVPGLLGRELAPRFAGSLPLLLSFVTGLAVLWGALGLAAGIFNVSLFSLLVNRLYLRVGAPREPESAAAGARTVPPRAVLATVAVLAVLGVAGVVLLVASATRRNQPVLVIAHRGASALAPENTLAAFRLAAQQGTDFVELDVQESSDGQVLVVHDSDLMKIGNSPLKVWETEAARLREVDIGSHAGPQFASERVATLAEALGAVKGRARLVVELKSYGHAQHLEERVAAIVEAVGMERDCVFMSLDHAMVGRMKALRPRWRCGVLAAKAVGDLSTVPADFLAVEKKLASRRFVRRAHRAGKDVYVWTVNDPADMLAAMSVGADGLITDRPDLARRVVARRAAMSDGQRVLVALLVRLGASTESLVSEDALRP